MARNRNHIRGSAMLEFTLAGVPSIMLLISIFQLSLAMWNYHTLAYAVHDGTRYAAVKGYGCTQPGNSCSITLGTLAQRMAAIGIGLPGNRVSVTFTTDSGVS